MTDKPLLKAINICDCGCGQRTELPLSGLSATYRKPNIELRAAFNFLNWMFMLLFWWTQKKHRKASIVWLVFQDDLSRCRLNPGGKLRTDWRRRAILIEGVGLEWSEAEGSR